MWIPPSDPTSTHWRKVNSGKNCKTYSRKTACRGCLASDLDAGTIQRAAARVVRDSRPAPSAVAARPHTVPRMGFGGHAATNASRDGDPVLRTLHGALPQC